MPSGFVTLVNALKIVSNQFDEQASQLKLSYLTRLSNIPLPENKTLLPYYDVLMFLCAYPENEDLLLNAENELKRITQVLKKSKKVKSSIFTNSGLPLANYVSHFSHDCVQWLLSHRDCKVRIDKIKNTTYDLNAVFNITLPSFERSLTSIGFSNDELLRELLGKKQDPISFIVSELSKLETQPLVKDLLFDALDIHICLEPVNATFSRAFNRLAVPSVYYHNSLLKRFDHSKLFNEKIPAHITLSDSQKSAAITVVKNTMALLDRETDPITYLDKNSFRLYQLERGISIAIYGMTPERQLPLESYVGYTLFKNGFPAAYGGSWVFGKVANFGINIFEPFRGGESGYIMCQLLRLYIQLFGISYFEVEPYQYGLDNPEGIESGAFWFYYRYGFRPLDKKQLTLANTEHKKITVNKKYRSSKKTLLKFTESNVALNLGGKVPLKVADITGKATRMIQRHYKGDRKQAELESTIKFRMLAVLQSNVDEHEMHVLTEVALWAEALKITDRQKLNLMKQMITTKPADLYKYQQLLLQC